MAATELGTSPPDDGYEEPSLSSPRIKVSSEPASTDSMVTVRLSQPNHKSLPIAEDAARVSAETNGPVEPFPAQVRVDSVDLANGVALSDHDSYAKPLSSEFSRQHEPSYNHRHPSDVSSSLFAMEDSFEDINANPWRPRSNSSSSTKSHESGTVDWVELDKTEEEESRDEVSDESTAFLLARLEQENNALATDPRFPSKERPRKQSRPPSMHMLKRLVHNPASSRSARYSVTIEPPPMTELEFWAALVKDYSQTAQRLPTLTANKIKSGVPPPLRGVVWMSMVGARDRYLADQFDKLVQEKSPYENLIGKDIGRSFPGVEMFREADGEGQQMLARVLKSFSLYDKEIGYCQGLGFLVGPLLMQMGDKDAFCVLVKLMENYGLRSCFLPDLSGLHLRIFQFKSLLDLHMPTLAAHLASLQIEAAYLSQWFLSFFAVTCPLPMLFRIYDVIFAEGASETIMRVALSLMKRNEKRIMGSNEFEDVMHLLLSRNLWESYNCNADDLVNDFGEMNSIVTHESMKSLETTFKAARTHDPGAWLPFLPDASAAASRFLGRLWTASTPMKSGSLTPGQAAGGSSRPSSFLRRSPSKQSIATSINSTDISSEGTNSVGTTTTEATVVSQESTVDRGSVMSKDESLSLSVPGAASTKEGRDLHRQIEDLLTALSEMQRQHSLLSAELQREREERGEDHQAFEELVKCLQPPSEPTPTEDVESRRRTMPYPEQESELASEADRRKTVCNPAPNAVEQPTSPLRLQELVLRANQRIQMRHEKRHSRSSQIFETKQRLRDSLVRSRDQLQTETSRAASLSRQLDEQENETAQVREALRDVQNRLRDQIKEKEKLEKIVQESRYSRSGSLSWSETDRQPTLWRTDTGGSRISISSASRRDSASGSGTPTSPLHELRLGRADSLLGQASMNGQLLGPSQLPARSSSLATKDVLSTENHVPATEDDLLVELVNAKTSEAVARQELEEVQAKLDAMRKMLGVPSPSLVPTPATFHRPSPSESTIIGKLNGSASSGGIGVSALNTATSFFSSKSSAQTPPAPTKDGNLTPPTTTPPVSAASGSTVGGGFWAWGKKSFSSAANAPTTPAVQAIRDEAQAAQTAEGAAETTVAS